MRRVGSSFTPGTLDKAVDGNRGRPYDAAMATVHLLSAAPQAGADPKALLDLEQLRASAAADRFGEHTLVDEPGDADLILFVETSAGAGRYFDRVRRHPVYRAERDRCYLFCSTDRPLALLPGVYTSIERRWYRDAWTRSAGYLGVKERGDLRYEPASSAPSLLYSFVGSGSAHPGRQRVLALERPDALIVDSDARHLEPAAYADAIRDAAFVLCPRGGGTATFRLFEAMMLGRPPVVIADAWVAPDGPAWDACSIRVAERDVATIPQLLEARRGDAEAMGAAAREAWLDWFAPEAAFHRVVGWCLDLAAESGSRSGARRYRPWLQFLRPAHAVRSVAAALGR